MGLIRYNGFQFFGSVLFLFIICHQCELAPWNFDDCASLKELCEKANWELPESHQECMRLYNHMLIRYGLDFIQSVFKDTKTLLPDENKSSSTQDFEYWRSFFNEVAIRAMQVESFLIATQLEKIPSDNIEWRIVKSFVEPKMKMILNPEDKHIIESVLESSFASKSDYRDAFVKMSKLYYSVIPSSKRDGILKYIGIDGSDNLDNQMAADKIADEYGQEFVQLIKSELAENSVNEGTEPYWNRFFDKVADLVIYVKPFLKVVQLRKIPTDYADWATVVSFIQPKMETIVIRHHKNKIQSLIEKKCTCKLEYVNAFIKMSKYYYSFVPTSKTDAFIKYFCIKKTDTLMDVVQKIGEKYFTIRDAYAISDAISLSRNYMEGREKQVLLLNNFSMDDCKSLITKVLILRDYYGLSLMTLQQPNLGKLLHSSIEDFLNSNPNYKASTLYPFSTPSTSTSKSRPSKNTIVTTTQTKLLTSVFNDYLKKYQSPPEEMGMTGKKNAAKLSNHYNMCRLMLLTNKPTGISNIRDILKGKTDEEICLAWQLLYEKLCGYIHEPVNRLEEPITNEEKVAAIKNLRLEENVKELLISIIEMDTKSSQKSKDQMDHSNTSASDSPENP